MKQDMIEYIGNATRIRPQQVEITLRLLDEGCTIPFIARYRKEATGTLDEVQILSIRDTRTRYLEVEKRRAAMISSLTERSLLTPALRKALQDAETLSLLEDIYLPYKQKKRTRGSVAKDAGLEPLAQWLLKKGTQQKTITLQEVHRKARSYLNPEHKITVPEDALAGARDILAEQFNEDKDLRQDLRDLFHYKGIMSSKVASGKKDDPAAATYKDYFTWEERALKAPSHRILAVLRGTSEGYLISHFLPPEEEALSRLRRRIIGSIDPNHNSATREVLAALVDGYRRLTAPSLENALRKECKERADRRAVKIFSDNVRELLLAPPLGAKRILAIDPGLRTGCKIVCLDAKGDLMHHDVIYPLAPFNQVRTSAAKLQELCEEYRIEAIAVGNGTGGREAEAFASSAVRKMRTRTAERIPVIMVNESGASVYSASPVAREEFPDEDVTVRGAVSIGRRLMDPLAELVKIDPKAIGVGQYQHDVNQKLLQQSLQDVITSCVNSVGVEINTASRQLLSYVSGITPKMAEAVCLFREVHGPFASRSQIQQVPGIGPKSFEQAAGFLRIRNAENPLDSSAVHPESYDIVKTMAEDLQCTIQELMNDPSLRKKIRLQDYVTDTIGIPTLEDILQELAKPGRDPRADFTYVQFSDKIQTIQDLETGMELPGIITNVTAFGAFVDIGVHQDGLVHVSQLSDAYVKDPNDIVKVNQRVSVKVLEIDLDRKRISLTMRR